jgi:hypothetical protein
MNNTTTNTTTNMITNTTTGTELGRELPNLQLAERVVGEAHGVYRNDIAEHAAEAMLGFPPKCNSTNSAATFFIVPNHSHCPRKKITINYQKAKNCGEEDGRSVAAAAGSRWQRGDGNSKGDSNSSG